MARGGDDAMSARWRRAIFSNPIRMSGARTHGESGRLPHRARRRCATTGEAAEGVEEEVRSRGHTLPLLREAVMGDGVTARAVGTRHYGGWGRCYKLVMKKFGEKFAKSLCKSYLCNELRDRTLN